MRLSPLRKLAVFLFAIYLLLISGCGGGSSSGGTSGNHPPPPAPELLFAGGINTVMSLSVDVTTGAVTPISSAPRPGSNGNFGIAATPPGAFVYSSDGSPFGIDGYSSSGNGSLSVLNGSPFPLPEAFQFLIGPVVMHPSGNFLYVVDPSSTGASAYTINASTGALTPMQGSPFTIPLADGPGVMEDGVISASGKFLYLADLNDAVWGYSVNQSTGALTLVPGVPFKTVTNGQPQTIQIDPSGKFVYVGLTNIYSIAGFTADPSTGALTPMAGSPFNFSGQIAGGFVWTAIDPAGRFLYVYNGLNYSVSAFAIDSTTGVPTPINGSPFFIPSTPLHPPDLFNAQNDGPQGPMLVDPSGKYLIIACSNPVIEAFSINSTTGALTWVHASPFPIPNSAIGLFILAPH